MLPAENKFSILIVQDDALLAQGIAAALSLSGNCTVCGTGIEAVQLATGGDFQVVIIDLGLEDDSALGVVRCLREMKRDFSIIILTPLAAQQERIMAIEAGADDFAIKPVSAREIVARVEVALVRSSRKPGSVLEVGPIALDLDRRRAHRGDKDLPLTPTELQILEILMKNAGVVVSRRMLCEILWNPDWEGQTNVIEVHINRLRRKVELPGTPQLIHTVRGQGYSMRIGETETMTRA